MLLTTSNVKAWAKSAGYVPSHYCGARTLAIFIHDEARPCAECGGRFTTDDDGSEGFGDWDWTCHACEAEIAEDGGRYFDPVAEHGTLYRAAV